MIHFELEGRNIQSKQWFTIGLRHTSRKMAAKEESQYKSWLESEGVLTGWSRFRIVKVTTIRKVVR